MAARNLIARYHSAYGADDQPRIAYNRKRADALLVYITPVSFLELHNTFPNVSFDFEKYKVRGARMSACVRVFSFFARVRARVRARACVDVDLRTFVCAGV